MEYWKIEYRDYAGKDGVFYGKTCIDGQPLDWWNERMKTNHPIGSEYEKFRPTLLSISEHDGSKYGLGLKSIDTRGD